jgi:hypothetical protein
MSKTPRNYLLLSLILAFSFIYRVVLMLRETFPPGADIGLHNSVIHSIIQPGNTDFLYNFYHMGGGSSVTFPGYHIFASYIILLTGLNDYVAQAIVVSLFSSMIVLVAFLLTRKVWNVSAAIIVAFLVAVSRFDIEMIMWGGYPNVITLMLIPLAFYLFLEKDKLTLAPFVVVTSLVSGAIFLTHSLSAVLFITITFVTLFLINIFAGKMGERRINYFVWIVPLVFGAIIVSPFLLQVAPAYLGSDAAAFTGGVADIRLALLATKILPLEIVIPLFVFVFLYFLFAKYYQGKFLTVPTLLIVLWWLIPTFLTQGYLVGLYTDFERFLYFVILPIIMLIGLGLHHSARFFSQAIDFLIGAVRDLPQFRIKNNPTILKITPYITQKNMVQVFTLVFVLFAFLAVPIFVAPSQGIAVQSFYQLMNKPEYEAIQWAQRNTPADAVFLTDAQYGWWFSGFAQRPTISAVEPQYLTNAREFEPAKVARYVLDTDYLVDNGLIQLREDGGYISRHNPEFLVRLNNSNYYSYFPYPFLNFDNGKTYVEYSRGDITPQIENTTYLSEIPVSNMYLENLNGTINIFVTRENQFFNFTQELTIYRGIKFVNVTEILTSKDPTLMFDKVDFFIPTKGVSVKNQNGSVVGQFDNSVNAAGQIIFYEPQPIINKVSLNGYLALDYQLYTKSEARISYSVGVYPYDPGDLTSLSSVDQWNKFYIETLTNNTYSAMTSKDLPTEVFDYTVALREQHVSYVVVRDSEQIPRFSKDPHFSLVFINNNVAIFQVHRAT